MQLEESALYSAFKRVAEEAGESLEGVVDPHKIADKIINKLSVPRRRTDGDVAWTPKHERVMSGAELRHARPVRPY